MHRQFLDSQDELISFAADFPRLYFLQIGPGTEVSEPTSLAKPTLIYFGRRLRGSSFARECLDQIGYSRSLESIFWDGLHIPDKVSLQAFKHSNRVTAFGIRHSCSTLLLQRIITVLSTYPTLRVLSMRWDGTTVPDSSLASLSSLLSLEQLHISSGEQAGGGITSSSTMMRLYQIYFPYAT
jgi:hypothetical protein